MSYVPTATTLNTATSNLLILNSKSGVTYDPEPDYKDLTLSGAATTRYKNLTVSNGGILRLGKVTVDNVEVYSGGVMRAAPGGTWYTVSGAKVYAGGSAFGMHTAGATLAGADTYFALGTLDGYKTAYTDENGYLQNFGCGGAFSIRDGMKVDNFTARSHLYMQGKAVARNVTFVSSSCNLSMLGGDYVYNAKMADGITHIGTIRLAFSGISLGGAETNFVGNSGGIIQWNNGKAYGSAGVIDANIAITNGVITGMKLVSSSTWLKDITLCEGILADAPVISSGGTLRLYNGGIASAAQVNATGAVNVSAGGLLSGATVAANGTVNISSGGVVSGGEFAYGAYFNVSSGGLLTGATLSGAVSGAFTQMVRSGGTVENCYITKNVVHFFDGAAAVVDPDRAVMYCRSNTAESGGTMFLRGVNVRAEDLKILSGGLLFLQNGAQAENVTVSGGRITMERNSGSGCVDSGARASIANVDIKSGGTMMIVDAVADRVDITSGWVSAGSSATLTNFRIYSGGSLTVTNNPLAEVDVYSGGRISGNNTAGTFENIRVSSGGTAYFNGILNHGDVRGGYLSCASYGRATDIRISGGTYVNRGQTGDITVTGGTLNIFEGHVSGATLYAGTLQEAFRGTVEHLTNSGATVKVYDSLNSSGTRDYVAGPISATDIEHFAGSFTARGSNAGVRNLDVYGKNVYIENGATVRDLTVFTGGEVTVRRIFGNYVEVDCEAVVSGATVKAGGKLTVTSGAVCDLDAEAGASVTFSEYKGGATLRGGKTTFAKNTLIYNGSALAAYAENGTIYDLGADGVAYRLSVGDGITVQDAFVGDDWRISAFGTAVLSGLRVTGTTDYASVIMVGQAKSYDAVLTGGGTTTLLAVGGNATAYDTVVNSGGTLRFNAGTGTMSGSIINADGTLDFNDLTGGHIEDTTLMAGAKIIKLVAGANTGSKLTVDFTGGSSISVNDLSAFSAGTTVFVKGVGAAGSYTLGQAGALSGVTCVGGLYADAVAAGASYTNAVTGLTYTFDGAILTAADAGIAATAAAASLADATTINGSDKAAKWDATTA